MRNCELFVCSSFLYEIAWSMVAKGLPWKAQVSVVSNDKPVQVRHSLTSTVSRHCLQVRTVSHRSVRHQGGMPVGHMCPGRYGARRFSCCLLQQDAATARVTDSAVHFSLPEKARRQSWQT